MRDPLSSLCVRGVVVSVSECVGFAGIGDLDGELRGKPRPRRLLKCAFPRWAVERRFAGSEFDQDH